MERGIQRAGFDLEQVFRRALNMLGDRVPMSRSSQQSAEDEQVERSLQQPNSRTFIMTHSVDILRSVYVGCLLAGAPRVARSCERSRR